MLSINKGLKFEAFLDFPKGEYMAGVRPVKYGANRMNMMSNGSFLDEMNASNKQEALVKSLTSAWEKKNSKVARAGGVSLMALSLAACGGSDDTPFSQVDVDAAVTAANAAAAAEAEAVQEARKQYQERLKKFQDELKKAQEGADNAPSTNSSQ